MEVLEKVKEKHFKNKIDLMKNKKNENLNQKVI